MKKGELILEFDKDEIVKAGYDITTPIIVSNTDKFKDVEADVTGPVKELDEILVIK